MLVYLAELRVFGSFSVNAELWKIHVHSFWRTTCLIYVTIMSWTNLDFLDARRSLFGSDYFLYLYDWILCYLIVFS